jgi:Rod binding domain-containing protein
MQSISAIAATGTQSSSVPQPRLVRAAHEFEAQMMKELLKPMTGNDALTGESEDSGGDSGSNAVLGEFASEALGRALSQHGGFGIANSIVHDLSHSGTRHGTGKVTGEVTGNPHGGTGIRTSKSLK